MFLNSQRVSQVATHLSILVVLFEHPNSQRVERIYRAQYSTDSNLFKESLGKKEQAISIGMIGL
jgi:hypothetical protein